MGGKKGLTPTFLAASDGSPIERLPLVDFGGIATSQPINIEFLDNVSFLFRIFGTGTADVIIQSSLDYVPSNASRAPNEGRWQFQTTVPFPLTISQDSALQYQLKQISAPYIRVIIASNFTESGIITTVADVAGSLNNTYFLLGVPQDDTTLPYYVWFNVSGGGVDPAVPGATGIEVMIATNDTADDVATALGAAINAVVDVTLVLTNNVAFDQFEHGTGYVMDSDAAPTGFIFTYTSTDMTATLMVAAKGI